MRTIKFRGKPIQMTLPNGEHLCGNFVYGYPLKHASSVFRILVPVEGGFENYKIAPETVGQFTGLYDCDGKEIYEGDILDFNGLTVEVRFVRGVFAFLVNGDLDDELCGDCRTDLFAKVIGNIHDNPELLKKELY